MIDPADQTILDSLNAAAPQMLARTRAWAEVNSGSHNVAGLRRMADLLAEACEPLGGKPVRTPLGKYVEEDADGNVVSHELGEALSLRVRPQAPLQVLLNGHYDTVFGPESPFQTCDQPKPGILRGPGVADMKGGLVVMLTALAAFEQSPWRDRIGWELLLVPDEEIGSPGSNPHIREAAARNHLGLISEPSPVTGEFVRSRMGVGVFTAHVKGRAAHAGRDFAAGRNAIVGLASFLVPFAERANQIPGVVANVGRISGGGAINIVPDSARAIVNVRATTPETAAAVDSLAAELLSLPRPDGIEISWKGDFNRPPKPVTPASRVLLDFIQQSAASLDLTTSEKDTGGGSDGNIMQDVGLPVIDSLGVRGDGLHSHSEHLVEASLPERARLFYLVLARIARGELPDLARRS